MSKFRIRQQASMGSAAPFMDKKVPPPKGDSIEPKDTIVLVTPAEFFARQ